jgi:mannose-6-phosphate isomerase-like protein (cupin superfamily)
MYGKLVMHDILTSLEGPDPQHPTRKGAVLTAITAISYATLDPGATASGRVQAGTRQSFYATGGNGQITVNGKSSEVRDGTGFLLTPDFEFKLVSSGKEPLSFYVRTEPIPEGTAPTPEITVTNRFEDVQKRNGPGAHWTMMGNGGAPGLSLITMVPRTMPQPHSHAGEECWIMVKGETVLSLGKTLQKMTAGQAYKIPPTGLAAHSNLNLGDEPVEMIFLGPATRQGQAVSMLDYSRLDNNPYNRATEPDVDMFMGNWRDSFPRAVHGNLLFRDMLTALEGADSLHPSRRGAVLTNAEAISYAMLEPGNSARSFEGELKGVQEIFVVNSGSGVISSGSKKVELAKDMAFVITPNLDFRLTNTGDKFMTFYVVTEKLPEGVTPPADLRVVDNRSKPQVVTSWVNHERPLIVKADGLSQYSAVSQVDQNSMTMSRPASAGKDVEEIWIATEGDTDILLGKQVRKLSAGTAYRVPSTGITAHANINAPGQTTKFLALVK